MNDLPLLLAFIAAVTVLTLTPGVDTAIVLREATASGRKPAAHAACGVALGCLIWGAAVSLGLGALLQASEVAYFIVKVAGAAYLVWLGGKLLLKPRIAFSSGGRSRQAGHHDNAFWRGFLTNLLNPKVGVFYVTFLPQFIPADMTGVAACSFFLACLHVVLTLAWFSLLITATAPLGRFLHRPSAVKMLDRATGVIFIAFGLKLAASSATP